MSVYLRGPTCLRRHIDSSFVLLPAPFEADIELKMTSNHQQSNCDWHYDGVDEAQTVLLAVLAKLFAGQQQERVWYSNRIADEEDFDVGEEIAVLDELNSAPADDPSVLRKRLLNRLSELLARRREASFISGCILVETSATVYTFRNSGFDDENEDTGFLNELSSALAIIRKGRSMHLVDSILLLRLN